jgi:hypothetical protein
MSNAEEIRAHVLRAYIKPARILGLRSVTFVSGEIHKDLRYTNRYPAICSAIDASQFGRENQLELVKRVGPKHGTKVRWTFTL